MTERTIFNYSNPKEILATIFDEKKKKNPKFSIRAWSRQLGYEHPDVLSKALRGKRKIKPLLAEKVLQTINLPDSEKKYFKVLVLYTNAKTVSEKEVYIDILESLNISKDFSSLSVDQFKFISDWYHIAILEMLSLKDFKNDPNYISKRLGDHISPWQVENAIERLIRLRLLIKTEDGKLQKAHNNQLRIGNDKLNSAIRKYHEQMLEKAGKALQEQSVDERDFSASTICISNKKLKKAKELTSKFHAEIIKLISSNSGDDVYQLTTQFFKLTNGGHNEG